MASWVFRGYSAKRTFNIDRLIFSNKLSISHVQCKYLSLAAFERPLCRRSFCHNVLKRNFRDHSQLSSRRIHSETSPINAKTTVAKDVILFKYENPRFFKFLNAFALCQFLFWSYLSHFCFTKLRDAPVVRENDDLPWWRRINMGENKFKNSLAVFCFIIGYGILGASWMFTLKSVRYLILRKGGKSVSFVTYAPLGQNRIMTVGLENVSAGESRKNARVQLPIKVRGHLMYYMLDMRGEFKNGVLFDSTAGLKRAF
ncbi:transmembrane protein 223 [Ischnura elegans]|uniref:transmembrane protein 223 n=1 Tax=Ischnura elegans TaxID=197161 RepID=UPI001ED88D2D|nr:transmembrane protein 223 [Ischnura elegans]